MYQLVIKFIDSTESNLVLSKVHQLVPHQQAPTALVYQDDLGCDHNIPFSSIKEFSFSPADYNATQKEQCESCALNKKS